MFTPAIPSMDQTPKPTDRQRELRHALTHIYAHNRHLARFITRELLLTSTTAGFCAEVFARQAKQYKTASPAGRPSVSTEPALWFARLGLLTVARLLRAPAAAARDVFVGNAEYHDRIVGNLRTSRALSGVPTYPILTDVDMAEQVLRARYPGLLDASFVVAVPSAAMCGMEAIENDAPAGPMSRDALLHMANDIRGVLDSMEQQQSDQPRPWTPDSDRDDHLPPEFLR